MNFVKILALAMKYHFMFLTILKLRNSKSELSSDPAKSEKVIKTIKLSSVAPRIYLESEEEVEKYVNMLKEKLLSALEENVRIRVEF